MEKTRTAEISIDEFGILHVRILGGIIMDKEDAADNFLVARHLTGGKRMLKLVDSRKIYSINKNARVFVEKQNNADIHIAKAILVRTIIEKYLKEFFLSLENPTFPVKIFTSEKKALEWLKSFL